MALTPGQIVVLVVGGILALAGFINTVGTAVEKMGKAVKFAKAPTVELSEQIKELGNQLQELQGWREETDRKLGNDKAALEALNNGNQAVYQTLIALLDHGIDGNNIKQMEDAKAELIKNLIKK